jgi:hypothetical protein
VSVIEPGRSAVGYIVSAPTPGDAARYAILAGRTTSHHAVEEIKAEEQDVRDSILTLIKEDPELLDDIDKAQEAMTVFETRPGLLEDAERFRKALGDS